MMPAINRAATSAVDLARRHSHAAPVFLFAALLLCSIWTFFAFRIQEHWAQRTIDQGNYLATLAVTSEQNVSRAVREVDIVLRAVRNALKYENVPSSWGSIIAKEFTDKALVLHVGIIGPDGMSIPGANSFGSNARIDLSDREHFRFFLGHSEDTLFISKPVVGRLSNQWSIQLARGIWGPKGEFLGVIVASLDPALVFKGLEGVVASGGIALTGYEGIVRAGTGIFEHGLNQPITRVLDNQVTSTCVLKTAGFLPAVTEETVGGKNRLVVKANIRDLPLEVVVAGTSPAMDLSMLGTEMSLFAYGLMCSALVVVALRIVIRSQQQARKVDDAQRQAIIAKEVAEAAARDRSMFLAVMSHEIRTPLNGVLGALDLIQEAPLDERSRQHLRMATASGEVLLSLIDDILVLSRMESGQIDLADDIVVLGDLVGRVRDLIQPMTKSTGNRLTIALFGDTGRRVIVDGRRLMQVLINLAGNANKFTHDGQIEIKLHAEVAGNGKLVARFAVSDTGIGIPEDKQAIIFNQFQTLDASYTRRTDGTGLGLAICDKIVSAMGGGIQLRSCGGEGSTFSFTLELPVSAESTDAAAAAPALAPVAAAGRTLRVLLAEDNATNAYIIMQYLEEAGHEVHHAMNGLEAVAAASTRPFDLVLMDISMPTMDGIEAAKRIRSGGGPNAGTKMFALTAHVGSDAHEAFRVARFDGHLSKPIRKATLLAEIGSVAAVSTPLPAARAEQPSVDPIIDTTMLLEFFRDREDSRALRLLSIFHTELKEKADKLEAIVAAKDIAGLQLIAHSTLGSGSMVGANRLVSESRAFECACQDGSPIDWAEVESYRLMMLQTCSAFALMQDVSAIRKLREQNQGALAA